MDIVEIGEGAVVHSSSSVMLGAKLGAHSTLECNSLLMKSELVPDGAHFAGLPARPVRVGGAAPTGEEAV